MNVRVYIEPSVSSLTHSVAESFGRNAQGLLKLRFV